MRGDGARKALLMPDRTIMGNSAEAGAPEVMEVTLDMISAGVAAYAAFDPEKEEPEALVFKIIYSALKIARHNEAIRGPLPARSFPVGSRLVKW
jgi:hypothetical protein